jgi:putative transcriptional regulator
MANIRKSLDEIRAARPKVDHAEVKATTEADIRRHAVEDGQDPDAGLDGFELGISPQGIRQRLGMTQEEFAKALKVPLATLRNWEQGRVSLDPAVRSLLTIVARNPKAALAALAA